MLSPRSNCTEFLSLSQSEEKKTVTLVLHMSSCLREYRHLHSLLFSLPIDMKTLCLKPSSTYLQCRSLLSFHYGLLCQVPSCNFWRLPNACPTILEVHSRICLFFFTFSGNVFRFSVLYVKLLHLKGKSGESWRPSYPPSSWNPSSSSRCSARVDSRSR